MITRRHFLKTSGAFSLGFMGLSKFAALAPDHDLAAKGYGTLIEDPEGVLDLPAGFSYQIISREGDWMIGDLFVPGRQDGMAAFSGPADRTILICNHEVNTDDNADKGAFGSRYERLKDIPFKKFYDPGTGGMPCLGGTTTMVYNTRTGELEYQFLSLAGTVRNCAGGPTPWHSWISCEETIQRADEKLAKDHGYAFEVPATLKAGIVDPVPLTAMGRFYREAVAVHPASGIVYQTEDLGDGLIYRFIPDYPGELVRGGRLQALMILEQAGFDTRNWKEQLVTVGQKFKVGWVDLDHVESPEDDLRYRGFEKGAALFARGEGMWYGNDAVYVACTNGGFGTKGQVWRYFPSVFEGTPREKEQPGVLQLFIEPNHENLIDRCDNVTVTPWGDLILCEDGAGKQFLVGVTPDGKLYHFARNAVSESEFAGATFSPDGSTLFVNIQEQGLTLAITGPWNKASHLRTSSKL